MSAGVSQLQDASWQDRVLIGVKKKGGSAVKAFAGLTDEVDLPDLNRDFEGNPVMNGGRVRENSAEEDAEITLTLYPIGVLTGDGATRPEGVAEWFLTSDDLSGSGEGSRYGPSLDREDFGVAVMWTNVDGDVNSTSPVEADSEIDTSSDGFVGAALRWVFEDCQITEFNQDFGDMVHTAEVTFKFSPYDETGSRNYFNESTQDTSTDSLPTVLDSY